MKVKIYVAGGGDQTRLKTKCRKGFQTFFKKALPQSNMPSIIACGSRQDAFDRFCIAIRQYENTFCILLVDSEAPVERNISRWAHLRNRPGDQWEKPDGADEDNAHLMVQCMESWFMADKECLDKFFGQGFSMKAIPRNPNIEAIPKADIFNGLKNATRKTKTKGKYGKGSHSFDILTKIDPQKVRGASEHAKKLLKVLEDKLS